MSEQIRTYRDDDLAALLDLHHAIAAAEGSDRRLTQAELEERILAPGYDRERHLLVAEGESGFVGESDVRVIWTHTEPYPQMEATLAVLPAARGGDLGERLIRAAWRQGAEDVRGLGADRVILQERCVEEDQYRQRLYESLGLALVRDNYTMVHDHLADVTPAPFPDGVQLRSYRVGADDERWWQAWTEAFRTHWGQIWVAKDYWAWYVHRPTFFPEISLIAATGPNLDEIAGFCHCRIEGRPGAPTGRKIGSLRWVGVRPAWRRQGLGEALTRAGLIALRDAGAARVYLGVDHDSWTGADRLYLRAGFTVAQRNLFYRREAALAEL
jgi:mycothiol synthase